MSEKIEITWLREPGEHDYPWPSCSSPASFETRHLPTYQEFEAALLYAAR
jgi:hypothetical protein